MEGRQVLEELLVLYRRLFGAAYDALAQGRAPPWLSAAWLCECLVGMRHVLTLWPEWAGLAVGEAHRLLALWLAAATAHMPATPHGAGYQRSWAALFATLASSTGPESLLPSLQTPASGAAQQSGKPDALSSASGDDGNGNGDVKSSPVHGSGGDGSDSRVAVDPVPQLRLQASAANLAQLTLALAAVLVRTDLAAAATRDSASVRLVVEWLLSFAAATCAAGGSSFICAFKLFLPPSRNVRKV